MQENGIGRSKIQPKEQARVKKLMYIEDPDRMLIKKREKEEQQRLLELKSQTTFKNFIYIQDLDSMQHIDKGT